MGITWHEHFAERARPASSSDLGHLLGFGSRTDLISLAGGFPAPELFPVELFQEALNAVMTSDGQAALQYGPTEGYLPLRAFLAERMGRFGISAEPEEVLITSGSQQGLDLVARLFVDPGSIVAVEDPSYVGGLEAFGSYQARYATVPIDEEGMQVDWLAELLPQLEPAPRLIYVLPNFQNPSGGTLSLARRKRLLELSYRHSLPIVEDDPYGELRYEGEHLPSLKSLDTEGIVINLGTFSKILSPGVRLGWVVAPREVIRQLVRAKQAADLHTASLVQRAAYEVCRTGFLDRHVETIKPAYRERRDVMAQALAGVLPSGSSLSRPQGGLFLWAGLPAGIDAAALLVDAVREGVAYVPGVAFHPHHDRTNTLRLNFSGVDPALIEEAVARLGRGLARHLRPAEELRADDLSPGLATQAA